MKKNENVNIGIGTASILMIFIIICLSILAVLSYVVSKTELRIIDKKVSYVNSYQIAQKNANEILSDVDEKLYEIAKKNIKWSSTKARDILKSVDNIVVDYKKNEIVYKTDVNSSIGIQVKLDVIIDKNKKIKKEKRYKINSWKYVSDTYKLEEDKLNLWNNK